MPPPVTGRPNNYNRTDGQIAGLGKLKDVKHCFLLRAALSCHVGIDGRGTALPGALSTGFSNDKESLEISCTRTGQRRATNQAPGRAAIQRSLTNASFRRCRQCFCNRSTFLSIRTEAALQALRQRSRERSGFGALKGMGGNPGLYGVLTRVKSSLGSRRSVTGATCQSRQLAVESPARRTRPLAAPRAGQVWTLWRGRFVPQDARTQCNVPSLLLLLQPRPAQSRWRASSLPGAQHPRRRTRHLRLRTSPRHVVASRCSPERRAPRTRSTLARTSNSTVGACSRRSTNPNLGNGIRRHHRKLDTNKSKTRAQNRNSETPQTHGWLRPLTRLQSLSPRSPTARRLPGRLGAGLSGRGDRTLPEPFRQGSLPVALLRRRRNRRRPEEP